MTIDPTSDRMMSVKEVADFFSVKPQTVRNWIHNGTLHAVTLNTKFRVARSEVIRYAQEAFGAAK